MNCQILVNLRAQPEHTLRELGNFIGGDLTKAFLGGLYAAVEPLGELVCRLTEIEGGDVCLERLPARCHGVLLQKQDVKVRVSSESN